MKLHLNQEFTIVNERTMDSMSPKTLGIPTIFITFRGVLDGQEYKTYIVEGFNNTKLWHDILSRPYRQLLIRFPNGKLRGNIINADSAPEIVATRDGLQKTLDDIFE